MKLEDDKLKEYIELVVEQHLKEFSGGGMRLRDIVGQPVKDVLNTAGYSLERISAAGQTLVKGISLLIPSIITGLEFNYDLFEKDERAHLDAIKKKYADTLGRNWEALKDPDVFGFMFLAYPQSMLGLSLMKKSPLLFLRVLEAATGGMESVRRVRTGLETSSAYTPRQRVGRDPAAGNWAGDSGGAMGFGDYGGYGGFGEGLIREDITPEVQQQIQALMADPQVKQALANSPMFKEMQNAAVAVMISPIAKLMKAQNLDQLAVSMSPDLVAKMKQQILSNPEYQQAEPKDQQAAMDVFMKQLKSGYKQKYIKWLQGLAQQTPQIAPEVQLATQQIYNLK